MLTIHKASAGSGKTYTLTYTYIKMLLGKKSEKGTYSLSTEKNRHRATLAITFTNKATDECISSHVLPESGLKKALTRKTSAPNCTLTAQASEIKRSKRFTNCSAISATSI